VLINSVPAQGSADDGMRSRKAHIYWSTDKELKKLKTYLLKIAPLPSLAVLNHKRWERYIAQLRGDGPN